MWSGRKIKKRCKPRDQQKRSSDPEKWSGGARSEVLLRVVQKSKEERAMKRVFRSALCLALVAHLIFFYPVAAFSQGVCSVFRTWATGDSLTAGDLNSSFSTVGVTNFEFSCLDDLSGTVAEMQTTVDPYPANSESLATTGAGEIQRLRFQIQRMLGLTYWFRGDENIRFDHSGGGTNIQGSGQARHVSAVGYHAWAGSARFPVYSTLSFHTTGIWFPRAGTQTRWTVAHHLAVSVGSGIDRDQTGIEVARFHLEALQFHHTVALRYAHSQALNTAWQYPHITAISLVQPQRGPDGALPTPTDGRAIDNLVFGHAATVMQLVGYGASHIALGSQGSVALGRHTATFTPVANSLYADTIVKAWVVFDGNDPNAPIQDSFGVASVARVGTGDYTVTWQRAFQSANYAVVAMCTGGTRAIPSGSSVAAGSINIQFTSDAGLAADCTDQVSVIAIGRQ